MSGRRNGAAAAGVLALVVLVAGCQMVPPEEDPAYLKQVEIDNRLVRVERIIDNQGLMNLMAQLDQVQKENAALRNEVETLRNAVDQGGERQRQLYLDIDQRLQGIEQKASAVARANASKPVLEGGSLAPGELPVPGGGDRANYQAAFELLKQGRYDQASLAFRQFLAAFPEQHPLGQCAVLAGGELLRDAEVQGCAGGIRDGHRQVPPVAQDSGCAAEDGLLQLRVETLRSGAQGAVHGGAELCRDHRGAPRGSAPSGDGRRGALTQHPDRPPWRRLPRPPRRAVPSCASAKYFHSIQGESSTVGQPTVFVRLTGCPLRCVYCDTAYAFSGGQLQELAAIVAAVAGHGARHVCVTGGEPLAQPGCRALLAALCDAGHAVQLETSGALDISGIDPRVTVIMDVKTPSSGESARNRWENLVMLRATDQVKFVICDRADYEWSRAVVAERGLSGRCLVLFSPAWGTLEPRLLAEWILADRLARVFPGPVAQVPVGRGAGTLMQPPSLRCCVRAPVR